MSVTAMVVTTTANPSKELEMEKYLSYIRECGGHSFKGHYGTATQQTGRFDVRAIVYMDVNYHNEDLHVVFDIGVSLISFINDPILNSEITELIRDIRGLVDDLDVTDIYPTDIGFTVLIAEGAKLVREQIVKLQRNVISQV